MPPADHNNTIMAGSPLRVLQITDTHLFSDAAGRLAGMDTDAASLEVLAQVLERYWPVDLILATGDLVHDGSELGYRRFKERFEQLGVPTLVIPGNHDQPEAMRRVMQGGRVNWSEYRLLGDWQFIMLDSSEADSDGGYLADDQLAMLERQLLAHPTRHAMIGLHHHPVSVQCRWIDTIGVRNADRFFEIIERHPQVRGVVWGHIHQAFEAERKGVRLFASPSTCIQFKPRQDDFALDDMPPGFRWFELHPDGRIETGIERVEADARGVDLQCGGYR